MTRPVASIAEWDEFIADGFLYGCATAEADGPIADLIRYWLDLSSDETVTLSAHFASAGNLHSLDVRGGNRHVSFSNTDRPYWWRMVDDWCLFAGKYPYRVDEPREVRFRSYDLYKAVASA
ncbi:hypothetical protein [Nocardia wallacei]|uniref:hypothetical protein n=1 Tax=Nocardia wallacei TaxID=480035 RepID=UPI00245597EF|nr:hypothetical protein [Nocardia wallacei]